MSTLAIALPLVSVLALSAPAQANPPVAAVGDTLVLSAPPRDSLEQGHRIFDPIAQYLSTVLGRKVIYRHPTTWGGYQSDMQAGMYDIAFDGPHFNSWRIEQRGHIAMVRIPGDFIYIAAVRRDNLTAKSLKRLAGRKICAHAPPNLGTLIMFNEFDNPMRQPVVIVRDGYKEIYDSLIRGDCEAAMLPLSHLMKYEKGNPQTRIIFRTKAMPQQAFSGGPRLTPAERQKVTEALLSRSSDVPLTNFRRVYGFAGSFVRANNAEYAGLARYLKNEWGYR